MIFRRTPVDGAFLVLAEPHADERGFFARAWCRQEFAAQGLHAEMVQSSISFNERAGTLRGLHFAWPPADEAKLVRCSRGRIHDVIVDLRPESNTFLQSFAVELDADRLDALYVPQGVAHGFQTLVDGCAVLYMMTDYYRPELAAGVRFDDPAFCVHWPLPVTVMAPRDRTYEDFAIAIHRRKLEQAACSKTTAK